MTQMSDRQDDFQLELFSKADDFGSSKAAMPRRSFMLRLRNYEKRLLLVIGFITMGIISFSLGVEKGKKIASSAVVPLERAAIPRNEEVVPVVEPVTQDFEANILAKKEQAGTVVAKGYTVQLASYKTKSYADKEAQLLKKKGLLPLVLTKGNYVVLCVGSFSSRSAAEDLLSELKKQKRYSGCLIRRL